MGVPREHAIKVHNETQRHRERHLFAVLGVSAPFRKSKVHNETQRHRERHLFAVLGVSAPLVKAFAAK
jgi:hypothetical protein